MKEEIIKLTKGSVVFSTKTPKSIGEEMELEVEMPVNAPSNSFNLNGTITDCRHIRNNGTSVYVLKMSIGNLSEENRLILDAYLDFLKRQEILSKIRKDNLELQNALNHLGEKLKELITVSEMLIKEAKGRVTLH